MRTRPTKTGTLLLALLTIGPAVAPSLRGEPAPVSYENQVRPLLTARCYPCHGSGSRLGGFQIDSREGILTGGQTHPAAVPGESGRSYLLKLVRGEVPGKVMPARGPRLTAAEVELLRAWIDEGLSFGSAAPASNWRPRLDLQKPSLPPAPPGSGLTNPVDLLLLRYRPPPLRPRTRAPSASPPAPTPLVDDRAYARRVFLDVVGLLPSPAELEAFLADPRADRRARLARQLLADNRRYAEHWLSFWNDALRNDYAGTGYIDGGRLQITGWLYDSLLANKPYDRFVAELVNPTRDSAGFVKGIVWRGVVNASQRPEMQAAQNISQVFMGVNLKCASCHDSFINTWKLADAYGMAGIYAEGPLEMVRCDRPLGKVAPIKFLYPELGTIDAAAPRAERMRQLAAILTSKANGRLPRTVVNRLWARLMGRGLVEPADEMDRRPWDPELLDWLAADLVENGYDVKKTIERIVTSRAYQLPSVGLPSERVSEFAFRGPVVKRMSAEQFTDAVATLTDVWPRPAAQFQIVRGQPVLPAGRGAAVRFRSGVMRSGAVDIDVDVSGAEVLALVVADGGNGGDSDWADWIDPRLVVAGGETPLARLQWRSASAGYGQVQVDRNIVEKPLRVDGRAYPSGIGTHANSIITYMLPPGATRFRARAGPDSGALETPGAKTSVELFVLTGDRRLVECRAALALADPLLVALGRPNREQVVTQRATVATTLQALELTNGRTLASVLSEGARSWAEGRHSPGGAAPAAGPLVRSIYLTALGRLPNAAEGRAAIETVGSPVRIEGIEDLLWALVMLPEFQLIY